MAAFAAKNSYVKIKRKKTKYLVRCPITVTANRLFICWSSQLWKVRDKEKSCDLEREPIQSPNYSGRSLMMLPGTGQKYLSFQSLTKQQLTDATEPVTSHPCWWKLFRFWENPEFCHRQQNTCFVWIQEKLIRRPCAMHTTAPLAQKSKLNTTRRKMMVAVFVT